ncbi:short subunit dehydrogenase [Murinocardiopsis flavida]|uniref:Short subunit dehydrogenase n=1 Tax=Murinocardiopsis flavida TaxID=645275 RepID=A0A2P8CBB3_9ACTN|nr:SDR family NAD(P)-dependent oxidoreductase [Murinocardiopsis flavida]PSK82235.1 short subunit dehydrogenase [Murinocardiopsis flavida]
MTVPEPGVSAADLDAFTRTVGRLRELPSDDPVRLRAERVAESFARDGRRDRRRALKQERTRADTTLAAATATGSSTRREDAPLEHDPAPGPIGTYGTPRRCYVCKSPYRDVDVFYHRLCPDCAAENTARRDARADLTGRRALLTGGRVKIGFQLALMLLRDGAELTVTTRFPRDALRRFRAAQGSDAWLHRLTVVGIDLRDPRQVLGLCAELCDAGAPLDILVNNAAQTIRRGPDAFARLAEAELEPGPPEAAGVLRRAPGFRPLPAPAPVWPAAELAGARDPGTARAALTTTVDEAGLIPDDAAANSWSARLGGLDPAEVLETQLVNALAPAMLCDRLLPLLLASPFRNRYIVNVTAVEGRFARSYTSGAHPHTNMAKAGLDMLTRTSAAGLAAEGVHMCGVDTGWITDENPAPKKRRMASKGFRTPLDVVDGAARVYDPIVRGESGAPVSGLFLKDYREVPW